MTQSLIKPALAFLGTHGQRCGTDRFELLAAIDETGTISAAAKKVGLSYKAAWDAVNALNNLFSAPLVVKQTGGKHGGGCRVTDEGRKALEAHRRLSQTLQTLLLEFEKNLNSKEITNFSASAFLGTPSMKTTARNHFRGTIRKITKGAVSAEICIQISPTNELIAIITNPSVDKLELAEGKEVYALIKASSPILMSAPVLMAENEGIRTSARNYLVGTVQYIDHGAVNAEVVIDLADGKTLTSIITEASAETLEIKEGQKICALIKSSHIILAVE